MKQDDFDLLLRHYRDNIENLRVNDEETGFVKVIQLLSGRRISTVRSLILSYPLQTALLASVVCNALLAFFAPDVFHILTTSLPL